MVRNPRRREFLTATGSLSILGLVGCLGNGDGGDMTPEGGGNTTDTTPSDGGGGTEFPSRPISMVVPFSAGGGTDTQYRLFKPYFEDVLGVSTTVDNRPGATGRTGFNYLAGQDPNGYTLGVISIATAILGQTLYDTQYDLRKMSKTGIVSAQYFCTVAQPGRFESLQAVGNATEELLGGTVGRGGSNDFALVTLLDQLGVKYRIVPFDSGQEIAAAVASGDVDIGMPSVTSAAGLVEDGKIEFLLIDRPDQSPLFPDAPTREDVQMKTPEIALELGMFGPAGIDDARVSTLSEAITMAAGKTKYQEAAKEQGLAVVGEGPEALTQRVDHFAKLAERYGEIR